MALSWPDYVALVETEIRNLGGELVREAEYDDLSATFSFTDYIATLNRVGERQAKASISVDSRVIARAGGGADITDDLSARQTAEFFVQAPNEIQWMTIDSALREINQRVKVTAERLNLAEVMLQTDSRILLIDGRPVTIDHFEGQIIVKNTAGKSLFFPAEKGKRLTRKDIVDAASFILDGTPRK